MEGRDDDENRRGNDDHNYDEYSNERTSLWQQQNKNDDGYDKMNGATD